MCGKFSSSRAFLFGVLVSLLAGCDAANDVKYGYNLQDLTLYQSKINSVVVGKTDEREILNMFGSPSITLDIGTRTFYYIGSKFRSRISALPLKFNEGKMLSIALDSKHIVSKIEYCDIKEANISFDKEKTPVRGKKLSVFHQFFKNFRRFSKASTGRL